MKHGQKLTREQRRIVSERGLDSYDFLYVKAIGQGWLLQSRTDPATAIVVYPDKPGIYLEDGTTPIEDI